MCVLNRCDCRVIIRLFSKELVAVAGVIRQPWNHTIISTFGIPQILPQFLSVSWEHIQGKSLFHVLIALTVQQQKVISKNTTLDTKKYLLPVYIVSTMEYLKVIKLTYAYSFTDEDKIYQYLNREQFRTKFLIFIYCDLLIFTFS